MTLMFRRVDAAPARPRQAPSARLRCGCAALALAAAAGPAHAELTAQGVRQDLFDLTERFGSRVEVGSERSQDGTLTLEDVEVVSEADAETAPTVRYVFPSMTFTERDDGSVSVTMAPEVTLTSTGTDRYTGQETALELLIRTEGYEVVVSETAVDPSAAEGETPAGEADGPRTYTYRADRVEIEVLEAGPVDESFEGDVDVVLTGYGGTIVGTTAPEAARYAFSGQIAEIDVGVTLPMPPQVEDGGLLPPGDGDGDGEETSSEDPSSEDPSATMDAGITEIAATMENLTLGGEATLPDALSFETPPEDPTSLFGSGLAMDYTLGIGATTYAVSMTDPAAPEQDVSVDGTTGSGTLGFSLGEDGFGYDVTSEDSRVTATGGGMPVARVEVGLDATEGSFRMPLFAGEQAQPFELRTLVSGLTMNEEVWALFDPEGRLARDPIDYLLAIGGRMRPLVDLLAPDSEEELATDGRELPFELDDADIELRLKALGASVEADGSFTFDNDDLETFGGFPAPTGQIGIVAAGIDPLLEALTDMGRVPPDQLMPVRMLLGLFARPDGSGGYTSEIAVDGETGSVTANDQRLR